MKRIGFLMVALLLMGGLAMAQGPRRDGQKMDPKARAEKMTERMAKELSLNDAQKQQLLEANMAFMEKMGRPEGPRRDMKKKDADCQATDSCTCNKKDGKKDHKARKGDKMGKEDRQKMQQDMKASRDAYDAQLKQILTKEQYDKYIQQRAERQQKRRN